MLNLWAQPALFAVLLVLTPSLAQNISASSCANPPGYTQCQNAADSGFTTCVNNAKGNQDEIAACACVGILNTLNCAMTDCWNVVYGCDYQYLANQYAYGCSYPVPYYPAPDNAPGGCSCNLGYITTNTSVADLQFKTCVDNTGLDTARLDGCTCCFQAAGYAAYYGICPNTNPAIADYPPGDATDILDVQSPNLKQGQCASALAAYDCNSLGYTGYSVPFMTSVNSATFGTGSLYTTNTKTLTAPASGATFTWTNLGIPYTIVAAKGSGGAAAGSSSSTKGGSSASSTGTAGTGSVGSASANTAATGSTASASQSTTAAKSSAGAMTLGATGWTLMTVMWLL